MLKRTLAVVLAASLAAPAAASALSPPIPPTHARALQRAGWKVTWPSAQELASPQPGATLRVAVAPLARRRAGGRARAGPRVVRVALVRVGADGRPQRAVTSRRLRRGTFAVRLPEAYGARYQLTVKVRGRTYRVPFATLRSLANDIAPPQVSPPPQPPPPPLELRPPCADHASGAAAATLSLDRTQVTNGDKLSVTIANTGERCLIVGYPFGFERRGDDGGWTAVDTGYAFILPAFHVVPGGSWVSGATIADAATMPPGRYRIVKTARPDGETRPHPEGTLFVSAEFDVVAAPAG